MPEVIAEALTTKSTLLYHRPHEAGALLKEAIRIAREADLPTVRLRAQFNYSGLALEHDRLEECREVLDDALVYARLRGDRFWEASLSGQLAETVVLQGDWETGLALLEPIWREQGYGFGQALMIAPSVMVLIGRGQTDEARALVTGEAHLAESTDIQTQGIYLLSMALLLRAEGRPAEALPLAEQAIALWLDLHQPHYAIDAWVEGIESALALDDLERAESLFQSLLDRPAIERRELVDGHRHRLAAKLALRRGETSPDGFTKAAEIFGRLGMRYFRAVALAEDAECGNDSGADEAREIFEQVGAQPWLDRLDAELARSMQATSTSSP